MCRRLKLSFTDAFLSAGYCVLPVHTRTQVFFEGHHVRDAYWKFIVDVSSNRLLQLNFRAMDYFGTNASTKSEQTKAATGRK